jgi:hypothetical protein
MDRREAARRSWRPEERDRDHPHERPVRSEAAELVLALQRGAGNHAVSMLLARAPETAKPKEKEKHGSAEDTGGSGPVESWTLNFASLEQSSEGDPGK